MQSLIPYPVLGPLWGPFAQRKSTRRHRPSLLTTDHDLAVRRAYAHGKSTHRGLHVASNGIKIDQPGACQQLSEPELEIPEYPRKRGARSMYAVCAECGVHRISRAATCDIVLVPYAYW